MTPTRKSQALAALLLQAALASTAAANPITFTKAQAVAGPRTDVGTGLCGAGLRPHAKQLVGCDLSQGMLERAAGLGLYDCLVKAELTQFLAARPEAFDAVVSADTLCYFGALDEVAAAAHRSLRPGGWLVFTVEALPHDDPPHVLQANGRYAHAQGHVRQALEAAGFDTPTLRPDTLRTEAGEPVPGWVVRARRAERPSPHAQA